MKLFFERCKKLARLIEFTPFLCYQYIGPFAYAKIPENNVSVHTRQGVDVHYAPCAG